MIYFLSLIIAALVLFIFVFVEAWRRLPPTRKDSERVPLSEASSRLITIWQKYEPESFATIQELTGYELQTEESKWEVVSESFVKDGVTIWGIPHGAAEPVIIDSDKFVSKDIKIEQRVAYLRKVNTTYYSHLSIVEKDLERYFQKVKTDSKKKRKD